MKAAFIVASVVAVLSTLSVIMGRNAVHALLSLILSLISVAVIFFILGAPFVAALEVIIYAGAIMVLFVFVIMMLGLGKKAVKEERKHLDWAVWIFPMALTAVLFAVLSYVIVHGQISQGQLAYVAPKAVGLELFGPYLCLVELAAILLLAGLLGACHLGKRSGGEPGPGRSLS